MEQKEFLEVIRKAVFKQNMKLEKEADEYISLFSSHSLVQYLYPVFKEEIFKKYYYGAIAINDLFEREMAEILKKFDIAGIKGIIIKGFYTKSLYPNPTLRVMGDVDLLVLPSDFKKACKILLDLGFFVDTRCGHHIGFQKGKMEVELHHLLMSKETPNSEFFLDFPVHIEKIEENIYKLEDTYHLLFMIAHYAKHMINGGSGIRSIIDMYFMLEKGKIDRDYLNKKLVELGYKEFFDTILSIIYYVFNYKFQEYNYNENVIDVLDYIINCGVHGFSDTNDMDLTSLSVSKKGKIRYLFGKVFLPYSTIKQMYPWTKGYILLPLGYIVRFFSLLFAKNKRKKIKKIMSTKKDEKERILTIYQKMGLSNVNKM